VLLRHLGWPFSVSTIVRTIMSWLETGRCTRQTVIIKVLAACQSDSAAPATPPLELTVTLTRNGERSSSKRTTPLINALCWQSYPPMDGAASASIALGITRNKRNCVPEGVAYA
jgi:hypothetical protein